MRGLFLLWLTMLATAGQAQFASSPTRGTFYVSVDDHASIYLNGKNVFRADLGTSQSAEGELKVGDHLVVHLTNDNGPRHLLMLFASGDGQTVVSFRAADLRNAPPGITDFSREDFSLWTNAAKHTRDRITLPVRSFSEPLWGDLDKCVLATVISQSMFAHRP